MEQQFWEGVYTAIVTPFDEDGQINFKDFRRLIQAQIEAGIKGLVVVGTTGESPTLNLEEHLEVVATAVDEVAGRIQVIAGTGSNDTQSAIRTTTEAHRLGVDGFLQVGPYYNKPSQEGLFQHFSHIAEYTDKPIMLYSIPGRSGIAIDTSTVVRLHERYPQINCIKEAGGSCDKVSELTQALDGRVTVLCGDDALTLPFMSVGAQGVVSVTSNLFPKDMVDMVRAALYDNYREARAIHTHCFPIFSQMLSLEPNPVCIKYALQRAGKISSSVVRLPLVGPTAESRRVLDDLLAPFLKA